MTEQVAEFYYGDHPADALGRAARRLSGSAGALSLGAGVGVERRGDRDKPKFAVVSDAGKDEIHEGPLSAVTRAFQIAGGMERDGTPGGKRSIADAARAARLYELEGEERDARATLDRRQNTWALPQYERDSITRAEATLARIRSERSRLMRQERADGAVSEEAAPNWMQVSPTARKKINPIVQHYGKMAHPFTRCVADNTKRFGPERAKRVCAVVKDMARGTTKWRKGGRGKVRETPATLADDSLVRIQAAGAQLGAAGITALVIEAVSMRESTEADSVRAVLGEELLGDLAICELCQPDGAGQWLRILEDAALIEALWPTQHDDYDPSAPLAEVQTHVEGYTTKTGRRVKAYYRDVANLGIGHVAKLPDGLGVRRIEDADPNRKTPAPADSAERKTRYQPVDQYGAAATPRPYSSAEAAAKRALGLSAGSSKPNALGGAKSYRSIDDAVKADKVTELPGAGGQNRAGRERTPKEQQRFNAANRRAQRVAQDRHRENEQKRVKGEEAEKMKQLGVQRAGDVPAGAKVKPADGDGRTSEHNPVYTKQADGSFVTDKGVKVANPSIYLWKSVGSTSRAGGQKLEGRDYPSPPSARRRQQALARRDASSRDEGPVPVTRSGPQRVSGAQDEYRTAFGELEAARKSGDSARIKRAEKRWEEAKRGLSGLSQADREEYTRANRERFRSGKGSDAQQGLQRYIDARQDLDAVEHALRAVKERAKGFGGHRGTKYDPGALERQISRGIEAAGRAGIERSNLNLERDPAAYLRRVKVELRKRVKAAKGARPGRKQERLALAEFALRSIEEARIARAEGDIEAAEFYEADAEHLAEVLDVSHRRHREDALAEMLGRPPEHEPGVLAPA